MAKLAPQGAVGLARSSETPRVGPLYPITGPTSGKVTGFHGDNPWGGLGRQQDSGSRVGAPEFPKGQKPQCPAQKP